MVSSEMEYAFAVNQYGRLINLYWGAPNRSESDYDILLSYNPVIKPGPRGVQRAEYPSRDSFDFGEPCLRAAFDDGAETLRLVYSSHVISGGELRVTLRDEYYPLEVELVYTTWGDLPLVGRRAVIKNTGSEPVRLDSAKSATFWLPYGRRWRLTHYAGDWASEYQKQQQLLTQSSLRLETSQLTDAAAHHTPFFALDADGGSTEELGEVYFGMLHWSGDFQMTFETQHTQQLDCLGVTAGISEFMSRPVLCGGESFVTPMFTCGFSSRGFGHMSEILYDWQFDYILPRGDKTDKGHGERPIICNTWYPYEFDIDEKKLLDYIPKVKRIGGELFVIDDGWMSGRTNDRAGLGDWVADPKRFPGGLGKIADAVHDAGLLFGIWVEPEMVNPNSDLYRAHPDWILSEPNRNPLTMRSQYILDMSREDIRDWAIDWLDELIESAKLDYLKWDMNRQANELGLYALERAVSVKYMRSIEYIWRHINEKYPDLLLENCASGGGRADFGMLGFADRVNRSDNADPIDVMTIHENYSTFFVPKLAGGAGNVSPSPNGINGRAVPLEFRIASGMTGSMSIGIDLLSADDATLERLKSAIAEFKLHRRALQNSYVYRIASVYDHSYQVLEYLERDKNEFTVFAFGHNLHQWDKQLPRFRMRGLDPDAVYESDKTRMSGAALMNIGIQLTLRGDYSCAVSHWHRI